MNTALSPETLNSIIQNPALFTLKKGDRRKTVVGVVNGPALGIPGKIFLKRSNYKNFPDFLYKKLLGSRARRLWKVSRALREKGLPVPEPIAYIEPTFKCREAFFISSAVEDSDNLALLFRTGQVHEPEEMGREVASLLSRWHMAGAVHGDMKWHNILVKNLAGERKYFLVDLDQAKVYERPRIKGIMKDLARFYRSGLEMDARDWVETDFLPLYIGMIDPKIRSRLNLNAVRKKALKMWDEKRSKKS